jgi:RNA polymerase sigma-70 factor (ECF subfamily)
MENLSDEKLIESYFKGDEKSLEILIRRYLKPIYNFIFGFVGGREEAEDITQEAFVKMWRHLKKFNSNKSFKTWLFQIAKNTAIDWLRKKKAIPISQFDNEEGENVIMETLTDPEPLPSKILEQKDLAEELAQTMEELSAKNRLVLSLYYNDHFTLQEIAEISEEPLNTIKSRHRRALIMLRKILVDKIEDIDIK